MDWYKLIQENNKRNNSVIYTKAPHIKEENNEILKLKEGSIKVYWDNVEEFSIYSFIIFRISPSKKVDGKFIFNNNKVIYYFRLSKDYGSILEYIFPTLNELKIELNYLKNIEIIPEYELYKRGWGTS